MIPSNVSLRFEFRFRVLSAAATCGTQSMYPLCLVPTARRSPRPFAVQTKSCDSQVEYDHGSRDEHVCLRAVLHCVAGL